MQRLVFHVLEELHQNKVCRNQIMSIGSRIVLHPVGQRPNSPISHLIKLRKLNSQKHLTQLLEPNRFDTTFGLIVAHLVIIFLQFFTRLHPLNITESLLSVKQIDSDDAKIGN